MIQKLSKKEFADYQARIKKEYAIVNEEVEKEVSEFQKRTEEEIEKHNIWVEAKIESFRKRYQVELADAIKGLSQQSKVQSTTHV